MDDVIENQQELAQWVCKQTGSLDLAVAFWGEGAIEALKLKSRTEVRILLDLSAGASNPDVVDGLRKLKGVRVKQLPRLHAKVYIGEREVVIGSANASANGLGAEGFEATHWTELSLRSRRVHTHAQAKAWFELQWAKGGRIDDEAIARARVAWAKRRRERPISSSGSILEVARLRPHELKDRNIWVNVCKEAMTQKQEREVERVAAERGIKPHAFYDWNDIPLSAILVCFSQHTGRTLSKHEPFICATPDKRPRGISFVRSVDLGGYSTGDTREWFARLRYHRNHYPEHWEDSGACVELLEFVRLTNAVVTVSG